MMNLVLPLRVYVKIKYVNERDTLFMDQIRPCSLNPLYHLSAFHWGSSHILLSLREIKGDTCMCELAPNNWL